MVIRYLGFVISSAISLYARSKNKAKRSKRSVDTLAAISPRISATISGFTGEGNNSTSFMKKKSTSKSAFFNLRILTAFTLCLLGVAVALFAQGSHTKSVQQNNQSNHTQDAPGTQSPEVVQLVGPVRLDQDLRKLPYVAPEAGVRGKTPDALSAQRQ